MQIPGVTYLNININGKGFERSLLWKLSAWSFMFVPPIPHHNTSQTKTKEIFRKLITFMLFGYRMKAISILGREVMLPRGLIGLGYDSLDHCGPEIAEVLPPLYLISISYTKKNRHSAPILPPPVTPSWRTAHKAKTARA